ncbi:hypothetical protein A2282_05250 [candidate division WOR-1 bacterium RIFOXYA12_FULL_36_13]|nr:MAG: hypothetical protein A2282_05250 [candidate division WOR-1 bacterium RIFOXYA12_FULL_36_13]
MYKKGEKNMPIKVPPHSVALVKRGETALQPKITFAHKRTVVLKLGDLIGAFNSDHYYIEAFTHKEIEHYASRLFYILPALASLPLEKLNELTPESLLFQTLLPSINEAVKRRFLTEQKGLPSNESKRTYQTSSPISTIALRPLTCRGAEFYTNVNIVCQVPSDPSLPILISEVFVDGSETGKPGVSFEISDKETAFVKTPRAFKSKIGTLGYHPAQLLGSMIRMLAPEDPAFAPYKLVTIDCSQ